MTVPSVEKLQEYMNEFTEIEQDVFGQSAATLFANEDGLLDLIKISVICKVLYTKIRAVRDEELDTNQE